MKNEYPIYPAMQRIADILVMFQNQLFKIFLKNKRPQSLFIFLYYKKFHFF